MDDAISLTINRVAAQGDGVAETPSGPVFVPFTLPGEIVSAHIIKDRGHLISVGTPSSDRIAPVCRHFGTCGGCAMQHMSEASYRVWKQDQVVAAFNSRGIDANASALLMVQGLRRRATLTARGTDAGIALGFHEAGTHDLVDIQECPVLVPEIVAALSGLKALLAPLMAKKAEVRLVVTQTGGGLDVAIESTERKLTPDLRANLARVASAHRLARVSIAGDPAFEASAPFLRFGNADCVTPPGSFLQAVAEAEAKMVELILAALPKVKSVADLFSGVGAFTFPLAARAKVFAADNNTDAIAALQTAARKATGLKPIETCVRDLLREPLSALELNAFDAVVFDPPRAGAEAQCRMLAKSKVKTVIAVSCNPVTLARDVRILIDGGYRLEAVTPIDQFRYTPHIEAVGVLRR